MSKKPAVVAKTVAKKRGRPVGSKSKPKVEDPFKGQFDAWAKKADKKYDTVDWKKLCERLQEALAKEMRENDELRAELERKRSFFERLVCLTTGSV
jgi:hypothetical protein